MTSRSRPDANRDSASRHGSAAATSATPAARKRPWQLSEAARRRLLETVASRAGDIGAPARDGRPREIDVDAAIANAVREETAAAIGRVGRRLQEAIAALAAAGQASADRGAVAGEAEYREMLAEAVNALWECVVQREAMGLTDHQMLDRMYAVPPVLWRMMGGRIE